MPLTLEPPDLLDDYELIRSVHRQMELLPPTVA